jgi:hypothetical protein
MTSQKFSAPASGAAQRKNSPDIDIDALAEALAPVLVDVLAEKVAALLAEKVALQLRGIIALGPDAVLRSEEAAAALGKSVACLELWRSRGVGPEYIKLGPLIGYRVSAIKAYIAKSERWPPPAFNSQ